MHFNKIYNNKHSLFHLFQFHLKIHKKKIQNILETHLKYENISIIFCTQPILTVWEAFLQI